MHRERRRELRAIGAHESPLKRRTYRPAEIAGSQSPPAMCSVPSCPTSHRATARLTHGCDAGCRPARRLVAAANGSSSGPLPTGRVLLCLPTPYLLKSLGLWCGPSKSCSTPQEDAIGDQSCHPLSVFVLHSLCQFDEDS